MGEIQVAIDAIDAGKLDFAEEDSNTVAVDAGQAKQKAKLGQIGEGKGQTLSKNQRKRAL